MKWFISQPKRTDLQRRALNIALRIYESDPEEYKDTMFCPYCGQPLVKSGNKKRFETLSEHVSNPNGTPRLKDEYLCGAKGLFEGQYLFSDDADERDGCKFGILHSWNDDYIEKGGRYMSEYWHKLMNLSHQSIVNKLIIDQYLAEDHKHEFGAALNSYECQSQIVHYHKGLKEKTLFPKWLTFGVIRLFLEYSYDADTFGRVTSVSAHLKFLKKDRDGSLCILGSWPWHTWSYLNHCWKRDTRNIKKYLKEGDFENYFKSLLKGFANSNNDSWIYRLHHWYLRKIHPIKASRTLEYFKIENFMAEWETDKFLDKWNEK